MIAKESDRQLLRRLARLWCDEQNIIEYVNRLEAIAQAAAKVVQNESFEQLEGAQELKEQLQELEKLPC